MEEIVLNIIIHAGNAKAKLYEALQASKENDFDKADNLLKEADEEVLNAHKIQTKLIQGEAAGDKSEISMLLIHSQDHLTKSLFGIPDLLLKILYLHNMLLYSRFLSVLPGWLLFLKTALFPLLRTDNPILHPMLRKSLLLQMVS